MKAIYNWDKATIVDIETDALLDTITKIHIVGIKMHGREIIVIEGDNHDRIKAMLTYHIENKIPIVGHNFIGYDVPALEKVLGMNLERLMVIDTLALSWYLNVHKTNHGLDHFFEEYGIKKPEISDWENLSLEEYKNRVVKDVEINSALWEDLKNRLVSMYEKAKFHIDAGEVGGKRKENDEEIYLDSLKNISVEEHVNRILTFLCYKMDVARLQESTRWKVDVKYLQESKDKLKGMLQESADMLEAVMPAVPVYAQRKPPSRPYKKNGELSASGERWEALKEKLKKEEKDEYGNRIAVVREKGSIHEIVRYREPNINSVQQVKDFLESKGWVPRTFKYIRDKDKMDEWVSQKPEEGSPRHVWTEWMNSKPEERAIPQITTEGGDGKELCESIKEMSSKVPEVGALENYSVIKHRYGMATGFLERMSEDGYLSYTIRGFANTLRVKHGAPLVNLPSSDKPFSDFIRGCLIAGEGNTLLGSDIRSLESCVAHHFMICHDPEYVSSVSEEGYDGHLEAAKVAGLVSEKEIEEYKQGKRDPRVVNARQYGKVAQYSCQYGAQPPAIARGAGVSLEVAKRLHEAYWSLNKSILDVVAEQVVITCDKGLMWLVNPLNGFLYSVRSEKDYFSTLVQGTGSFLFDMWSANILRNMKKLWGKSTMTAQYHDEIVLVCKDVDRFKERVGKLVVDSLEEVNDKYKLRVKLSCDIQWGYRYSDVH